jgi:hypothetical protein
LESPTSSTILNESSNVPERLITVNAPSGSIDLESVYEFDLTKVNPKSLRNYYSSHELEPTDEFDEMSRPYQKFVTGPLYSTGDYLSLYNTLMNGQTPVLDLNYRVPNVREGALMMLYCNNSNWWDGWIHTATYYSRGPMALSDDMKIKEKYTWVFGVDNFSSLGAEATKTRTVRDISIK